MKKYVIKPLYPEYEYIPISATELEHFVCPMEAFKTIQVNKEDPDYMAKLQMKDEVFAMGSYVESIIQAALMGGRDMGYSMAKVVRQNIETDFNWYKRSKVVDWKPTNKEREFVYNNLEKYVDENMKLYEPNYYNTTNFRQHVFVECGKYLFYFTWEVDTARIYGSSSDIIIDHKLSSQARTDETIAKKRQMYYYPFLTMLWTGQKFISFIYNVNRKLKNIEGKTQFLSYEISMEKAEEIFREDIKKYAVALYKWEIKNEHLDLEYR